MDILFLIKCVKCLLTIFPSGAIYMFMIFIIIILFRFIFIIITDELKKKKVSGKQTKNMKKNNHYVYLTINKFTFHF